MLVELWQNCISVCDPLKILTFVFRGLILHAKKQQTTELEESHGHITSHQAPAALLLAEKNIIKLGSNVCVYIYIYTIITNK